MKNTMRSGVAFVMIILLLSLSGQPLVYGDEEKGTPAGIGFSETTTTSTSSSSSSSSGGTEPSVPKKPIIKPGGKLPVTGELATPIIFIVLGMALITLVFVLFLSHQKNRNEEEE